MSAGWTANARRDCEDSPRWALVQRSPEVFSTVAARVEPAQHVQEGGGRLALGGGGPLGEVSSERVHLTSKRAACSACGYWVERERRAHQRPSVASKLLPIGWARRGRRARAWLAALSCEHRFERVLLGGADGLLARRRLRRRRRRHPRTRSEKSRWGCSFADRQPA